MRSWLIGYDDLNIQVNLYDCKLINWMYVNWRISKQFHLQCEILD